MSLERPLPPAAFLKAAEEKAPSPRKETYRALWLPLWREPWSQEGITGFGSGRCHRGGHGLRKRAGLRTPGDQRKHGGDPLWEAPTTRKGRRWQEAGNSLQPCTGPPRAPPPRGNTVTPAAFLRTSCWSFKTVASVETHLLGFALPPSQTHSSFPSRNAVLARRQSVSFLLLLGHPRYDRVFVILELEDFKIRP